jgi:hypothetical protein
MKRQKLNNPSMIYDLFPVEPEKMERASNKRRTKQWALHASRVVSIKPRHLRLNHGKPRLYVSIPKNCRYSANFLQCPLIVDFWPINSVSDMRVPLVRPTWHSW